MNNVNEIALYILQDKYLKKTDYGDLKIEEVNEGEIFPEQWSSYNINTRLEIVKYALSHDCTLFESLEHFEKNYKKDTTE